MRNWNNSAGNPLRGVSSSPERRMRNRHADYIDGLQPTQVGGKLKVYSQLKPST